MDCISPQSVQRPNGAGSRDRITVPCGKCFACQSKHRAEWSFRIGQELRFSSSAHFVTLTYSDENIPLAGTIPSLSKFDLQAFLKRLRYYVASDYLQPKFLPEWVSKAPLIRYYAVGEYGSITFRPHYHLILFNVNDNIIQHILNDSWTLGQFHIGTVNGSSINYVTKYLLKFANRELLNQQPFALMSKGLGRGYLDKTSKFHIKNKFFDVVSQGIRQPMPRYFKQKLFTTGQLQERSHELQSKRDEDYRLQYEQHKENYSSFLAEQHEAIKQRVERMKRTLKNNSKL